MLLLKLMLRVMKYSVIVSCSADLVLRKKLSLADPLPIIYAMKVIMPSFIMCVSKVVLSRSEFR